MVQATHLRDSHDPSLSVEPVGEVKVRVRSVVLTQTNELYARVDQPGGTGLFHFDRESSTWVPIDTSAAKSADAPFYWLEGSEGNSLVYLTSGGQEVRSTLGGAVP